jgi:hypothetical protein
MDATLTEYQLRPQELAAVKTLEPLKVAEAGAHPILAWTAIHLVAADMRAQGLRTGSSKSVSEA